MVMNASRAYKTKTGQKRLEYRGGTRTSLVHAISAGSTPWKATSKRMEEGVAVVVVRKSGTATLVLMVFMVGDRETIATTAPTSAPALVAIPQSRFGTRSARHSHVRPTSGSLSCLGTRTRTMNYNPAEFQRISSDAFHCLVCPRKGGVLQIIQNSKIPGHARTTKHRLRAQDTSRSSRAPSTTPLSQVPPASGFSLPAGGISDAAGESAASPLHTSADAMDLQASFPRYDTSTLGPPIIYKIPSF